MYLGVSDLMISFCVKCLYNIIKPEEIVCANSRWCALIRTMVQLTQHASATA